MLIRLIWTSTFKLAVLMAFVVTSLAGISRAVQPPMPPLSYVLQRQSIYYVPQTSCVSFFETCAIPSRQLIDNLYSFPYASWSPGGSYFAAHLQEGWAIYPADCLLNNSD